MLQLHLVSGLPNQFKINLRTGGNSIGSSSNNNIVIDHPTISAQHAIITVKEGNVFLEDLNSTNGTYLNGLPVKASIPLRDGDQIFFGTTIEASFTDQPDSQDEDQQSAPTQSMPSAEIEPSRFPKVLVYIVGFIALAAAAWYLIWGRSPSPADLALFIEQTVQAAAPQNDVTGPPETTATLADAATALPGPTEAPTTLATPSLDLRREIVSQDFELSDLLIASGKDYKLVKNSLSIGTKVYIDRDYAIKKIPSFLEGLSYLSTAADDNFNTQETFISFTSIVDLTIYIIWDTRYTDKPAWFYGYSKFLDQLELSENGGTYDIYRRQYPAGQIVLGGNYPPAETGNFGMYFIVLAPSTMNASLEPSSSGSGLPSLTMSGGTGYLFSSNLISAGNRDIWWNNSSLSPNPNKMLSLGLEDSLLDLNTDQAYELVDYGSFTPRVGEVFILEIMREGATSYVAIRVLELTADRNISFEFRYPFE